MKCKFCKRTLHPKKEYIYDLDVDGKYCKKCAYAFYLQERVPKTYLFELTLITSRRKGSEMIFGCDSEGIRENID